MCNEVCHTVRENALTVNCFTLLKIIVSIFVKLFVILVLHLRQFFIVRIFVKRATGMKFKSPIKLDSINRNDGIQFQWVLTLYLTYK